MMNYVKILLMSIVIIFSGLDLSAQNVVSRPLAKTAVPDCVDAIYDPGGKGKYPDSCHVDIDLWNADTLVLSEIDLAKNDQFEVFYQEFGKKVTVFNEQSKKGSSHTVSKYRNGNIRLVLYSNNDGDSAGGFKVDLGCSGCKIGQLKASRINNCQGDSITVSYSDGFSSKINWLGWDSAGSGTIIALNADTFIKLPANTKIKIIRAQGCKYSDALILDASRPKIYVSDSILCAVDTVQLSAELGQSSSPRYEETFENFYSYYHDLHQGYSGGYIRDYCGTNTGKAAFYFYYPKQTDRYYITRKISLKTGYVGFSLQIMDTTASSSCGRADSNAWVELQYSIEGDGWKTINRYHADDFGSFKTVQESFPFEALFSDYIQFKWVQPKHDGLYEDVWAIDDIKIGPEKQGLDFKWSSNVNSTFRRDIAFWSAITTTTDFELIVTDSVSGCSDTISKTIYVLENKALFNCDTLVSIFDTVAFTNVSDSSGFEISYEWTFGDGNSSNMKNPKHIFTDTGTYEVKLTISNPYGCIDSIIREIRVNAPPNPDFTFNKVCAGALATFVNSTQYQLNFDYFIWEFGDGSSDTSLHTTHIYSSTGTYIVKLISVKGGKPQDTIDKTITMLPSITPNFSFVGGCQGEPTFFTDLSTVASGSIAKMVLDYESDGLVDTTVFGAGQVASKNFASAGNYDVTFTAHSVAGCQASLTRRLKIDFKPNTSFDANVQCIGTELKLIDKTSISTDTVSNIYYDFNGDGLSDTTTGIGDTLVHVFDHGESLVVLQIAETKNGCRDTSFQLINPKPTPQARFNVNNPCLGDTTFFADNSRNKNTLITSVTYDFDGDGTIDTSVNTAGQQVYHLFDSIATWPILQTVTASNGCQDTALLRTPIRLKPVPNVTFSETCDGDAVIFRDSSTIAEGYITAVDYDFNNDDSFDVTGLSPLGLTSYQYSNAGAKTLRIRATSDVGCVTTISTSVGVNKNIVVDPTPSLGFEASNTCQFSNVSFNDTSSITAGTITQLSYDLDGDGLFDTIGVPAQSSITNSYLSFGDQAISVYAISNKGCEAFTTQSVELFENVLPNLNFSQLCLADTTQVGFSQAGTSLSGQVSSVDYDWNFDGVFDSLNVSAGNTSSYYYSSLGAKSILAKSTTVKGCQNVDTQTFVISPLPIAGFEASGICLNDQTRFTDTSSISSGQIQSYAWSLGDGGTSTQKNPSNYYTNSGTYQVELAVTSRQGCKQLAVQLINISPAPDADFSSANICIHDSAKFYDSSTIVSGTLSHLWSFGNGNVSANPNPSHLFASHGNYTIQLQVQSSAGCRDSISKTITIHNKPNASFSANNVCFGNAVSFVNKTTGGANYQWLFGDNSSSTNVSVSKQYNSAGTYQVELIAESNKGCKDTANNSLSVYAKPSISFSAKNVCLGVKSVFSNTTTGGQNYFWNFDNGFGANVKNPSYTYPDSGAYSVQLIAESGQGCRDTLNQTLVIYPLPELTFSVAEVCLGDSTSFINRSSGATAYSWQFGDGNSSLLNSPKHLYAKDSSYTVMLTGRTAQGCQDSLSSNSLVNPNPIVNFTADTVCLGSSTSFTNLSSIKKGSMTYAWSFSGGSGSSTLSHPSYQFGFYGTSSTSLTATSDKGCTGFRNNSIRIHNVPTARFSYLGNCIYDSIAFSNNSVGTGLNANWIFGDGDSSTLASVKHRYKAQGLYKVSLQLADQNNCLANKDTTISIDPQPLSSFTFNDVCQADTVQFSNTSSGASAYSWLFAGAGSSSIASPNYHFQTSGSKSARLIATSNKGCSDTSTQTVNVFPRAQSRAIVKDQCLSDSVDFQNNSVLNTFNIWDFGDNISSSDVSTKHLYTKPGVYVYSLIVGSTNGCQDTLIDSVEVFAMPTLSMNFSNTCFQDTAHFSASTTNTSNLKWTFGDGGTSTTLKSSYLYSKPGSYTVQLKGVSIKGCVDSVYKDIIIHQLPDAKFSQVNVCHGGTNAFLNNSSGSGLKYDWDFGDGMNTSTATNPRLIYQNAGGYDVSLVVTDFNKCKNEQMSKAWAYPLPDVGFRATEACVDDSVHLNDTSTIAFGSIAKHEWFLGDGGIIFKDDFKYRYQNAGQYLVELMATSDQGCRSFSDQLLRVYPKPNVHFQATTICVEELTDFRQNNSISFGSIDSLHWELGDLQTSGLDTFSHFYSKADTYSVVLSAFSNYGCSNMVQKEVYVKQKPVAKFQANNNCYLIESAFANQSANADNYRWNLGNNITYFLTNSVRHTYINPGRYQVELIANKDNGCSDTAYKSIEIYTLPVANFTAENICAGSAAKIENLSNGQVNQWNWTFNDNTSFQDSIPNPIIEWAGWHKAQLAVEDNNGCKDTVTREFHAFEVQIPTSSEDVAINKGQLIELFSSGAESYDWLPKEPIERDEESTVWVRPLVNTQFLVSTTDGNGCVYTDTINVDVNSDYYLEPTTLFTPDGNGQNERWLVKNIEFYDNCQVLVFNKAGRKVFESDNYRNTWDGTTNSKPVPDGTYYYVINCNNDDRIYKGTVTILRKAN